MRKLKGKDDCYGSTVLDNEKVNVYKQVGANAHYRITLTSEYADDGDWERYYFAELDDVNYEQRAMKLIFELATRTKFTEVVAD